MQLSLTNCPFCKNYLLQYPRSSICLNCCFSIYYSCNLSNVTVDRINFNSVYRLDFYYNLKLARLTGYGEVIRTFMDKEFEELISENLENEIKDMLLFL